ncbi:Transposase, Mutator family, partial [Haloechinothrix alba]
MSVRDIRSHLAELYGVEVSGDVISRVPDAVAEEITTWQNRPLDPACSLRVVANPDGRGSHAEVCTEQDVSGGQAPV